VKKIGIFYFQTAIPAIHIFVNISAKMEIFLDIALGTWYYQFMQKNRVQKSQATVPVTVS